jgi:hypothetical protein
MTLDTSSEAIFINLAHFCTFLMRSAHKKIYSKKGKFINCVSVRIFRCKFGEAIKKIISANTYNNYQNNFQICYRKEEVQRQDKDRGWRQHLKKEKKVFFPYAAPYSKRP